MATTRVTGTGVSEMKILAAKLHAADADLKKNLRREMRAAGKPVVAKVQRSILDMPAASQKHELREEVAATVYASVSLTKTQVQLTIVSSGRRMPEGKRGLPAHIDAAQGWSHPVYGHRDRWVRQRGKTSWFERPISESAGDVRQACADAIGETLRRLA
jgi:hypothetical protein